MNRGCQVVMVMLVAASVFADEIKVNDIQGGIVVQIGCQTSQELLHHLTNERVIVHGLDTDIQHIAKLRNTLRAKGLYGKISVAVFDGKHLPYTDNLINRLIIRQAQCQVPDNEIMRVLVPGGIALTHERTLIKPVPGNIDAWTHYLHGPDNNAVANDTVVGTPRSIQWVSKPKWGRSHEEAASMSALVSSGGKLFYIIDEAPNVSIRFMANWKLVARDAYNGSLLWKRPIPLWSDHLRHFRAGPIHLPRRLVALNGKVYVTLGIDAPVSILDAHTGETLKVLSGTERTEEIIVENNTVYCAIGTSEVHRWGDGLYHRDEPESTDFRYIAAYDSDSGTQLWRKDFTGTRFLLPQTLTVRKGSVYYQDITGVGRLDARTGTPHWRQPRPTVSRRMSFASPCVVATDDILLVSDRKPKPKSKNPQDGIATDKVEWGVDGWNQAGFARKGGNQLIAYSVQDGAPLWKIDCAEGYNSPVDIFVIGDRVYVGAKWQAYELKTGTLIEGPSMKGDKVGMPHHRCYRNKASTRYVFTGRSGIEIADLETGWQGNNSWIRGTCQYGILPANGLLYAPPNACACFNKVKVQGFFAAATAREIPLDPIPENARLSKGPAYGDNFQPSALSLQPSEDWPLHRHDGQRSGAVQTTVSHTLKQTWSTQLCGRLTQPVVVDDTVYVAETDSHTVYALNTATGGQRWHFTANGRIDSTPSIFPGLVLFGSADGFIYALRAADGVLAWRFQAAPYHRLVASFGQLESTWPVHGSVLIQDGTLYASAGRNTYLDEGIVLYKLNPHTGAVLQKRVVSSLDPTTDKQLGPEARFDMDGVHTDLLSGHGDTLFMKQMRFTTSLQDGEKDAPHLFGIHGFLGEEWFVRSYWLLGTDVETGWGGWASGDSTTFGRIMAFNDRHAYGYGRVKIASAAVGHKMDDYHLFGVQKVMMQTNRQPRQKKTKPVATGPKKPTPFWSDQDSLIVRAMALTRDKLLVAGPPDLRKRQTDGVLAYLNDKEALASFKGEKGVYLRVVNTTDGKTLSEKKLNAMPVFDGLSAARGKVFVSLKNGQIQCWE
jgi:outer membrane protein assembly factor BamB